MRRSALSLIVLALALGLVALAYTASVVAGGEDVLPKLREVVKPASPLSKRIHLVLDTSSSMTPHVGATVAIVRAIVGQPIDEFEIAVTAFDSVDARWPGVPEPNEPRPVPPGWARLPSATALTLAEGWLMTQAPKGGGTEPDAALKNALAEERSDLSIVYVTDGEYDSTSVMQVIREGQAKRKEKGLGPAVIAVYGIVVNVKSTFAEHLKVVATEGKGGMWVPLEVPADVAPVSTW